MSRVLPPKPSRLTIHVTWMLDSRLEQRPTATGLIANRRVQPSILVSAWGDRKRSFVIKSSRLPACLQGRLWNFVFSPHCCKRSLTRSSKRREREGDPTYYKEFHELADPIYEKFTLDDRESEFKKLYQYMFRTWGFSDIIRDAFNEYPLVKERVGIVLVKGSAQGRSGKASIFSGSGDPSNTSWLESSKKKG